MFYPKPIAPQTIDLWSLEDSGLPSRAVTALSRVGLKTVGELRGLPHRRLDGMPGVGRQTRNSVLDFLQRCEALTDRDRRPISLRERLTRLLSPRELTVLTLRYGFSAPGRGTSNRAHSLQSVGDHFGISRERARQLVTQCRRQLRTHYARAMLAPLNDGLCAALERHGGVAPLRDIASEIRDRVDAPYAAAGLIRLMADGGGDFSAWQDIVVLAPAMAVEQLARRMVSLLHERSEAIALTALVALLPPLPEFDRVEMPRLLEHIADRSEGIALTSDGRCFAEAVAAPALLTETMQSLPSPASHRTIQEHYNRFMRPGSRRGKRFILNMLNNHSRFVRSAPGCYQLQNGATPSGGNDQ